MADVDSSDLVVTAQVANGLEHMRLGRDVEARRRLVEDDHLRAKQKRHRDADPLLLSAGELVWIPAEELAVGRQA